MNIRFLKKYGLTKGQCNQVANYAYMQSEINIKVGNKAPEIYLNKLREQCNNGKLKFGGINDFGILAENFKQNCIPESIFSMNIESYDAFLEQRRSLMAKKIKKYYFSL
jgi:hypothetical protein